MTDLWEELKRKSAKEELSFEEGVHKINVLLVVKAANMHFDEMELMFGEKVFEDFYKTLSENRVEGSVERLYNIKWTVMVIPAIFYLYRILRSREIKD